MEKLFLLKPKFQDIKVDGTQQDYYCPHCAMVEGVLAYYPDLRKSIEVIYIDFPRPRKLLVDLVGEENQGCPNLVILKDTKDITGTDYFNHYGDVLFVNKKELIVKYLANKYKIGKPHP